MRRQWTDDLRFNPRPYVRSAIDGSRSDFYAGKVATRGGLVPERLSADGGQFSDVFSTQKLKVFHCTGSLVGMGRYHNVIVVFNVYHCDMNIIILCVFTEFARYDEIYENCETYEIY